MRVTSYLGGMSKDIIAKTVTQLLANFDCQPVLFVGAGLPRRYMGALGWDGALRDALDSIGIDDPEFDYFVQKNDGHMIGVGTDIADVVFEWAWADKDRFPEELYKTDDKSIFLKHTVATRLPTFDPEQLDEGKRKEFELLREIRPHAIITTNYDSMLESIFEGYEAIVGKGVLKYNLNSYGEIFHIHGIATEPASMVLVKRDYEQWHRESQYFAAKLLTYFVEHPIFIFGYGLGDPNIKTVLSDIGRIVADETGLITNVIQIVWNEKASEGMQKEYAIEEGVSQYRIRVLETDDLSNVYELLAARHELKDVNPAMVRALAARVMKLTRKDIPNGEIEVDYKTLEAINANDDELPKMLGLTIVDDVNKTHPFPLSLAAEKMGLPSFNNLIPVINKIRDETGVHLRETDNRYHVAVKTGKSSISRKWSHEAIALFQSVLDGEEYELKL